MIGNFKLVSSSHGLVKKVYIDGIEQEKVSACFVNMVPDGLAAVYLKYQPEKIDIEFEEASINKIGEMMEAGE